MRATWSKRSAAGSARLIRAQLMIPPDCPPPGDLVFCNYVIDFVFVVGDPILCQSRGIVPGNHICVWPCPFRATPTTCASSTSFR